jgi:hypothetical protein
MEPQRSGAVLDDPGVATFERRALALWPRLDRSALRRCGNDPTRIAALISRRTAMPPEQIVQVLVMTIGARDEAAGDADTWFG